jgi:hypothetical protein
MRKRVGIIIEISSKGTSVNSWEEKNRSRWLDKTGHITKCIVLLRGRVAEDLGAGLKFQIDIDKGEEPENFFSLPWEKILEVRTLDGRPFFRNWNICQKCRQITKFFLDSGRGPFCLQCECRVSQEENRKNLISPHEEE